MYNIDSTYNIDLMYTTYVLGSVYSLALASIYNVVAD
jgi:hypothetical protein